MTLSLDSLIKIAAAAFGIISFLLVGLVLLFGIFRRPSKVHAGLLLTLIAAVFAFAAAMLLRYPVAGAIFKGILAAADNPIPVKTDSVTYSWVTGLFASLIAPGLFAAVFFVTKLFLCCFNPLFAKLFPKDAPAGGLKWLVKLGAGTLNGLLILAFLMVPVIGTARALHKLDENPALRTFISESSGQYDWLYYADLVTDSVEGNPAVAVSRVLGGGPVCSILSSVRINGEKTDISEQLDLSAETAAAAADIATALKEGKSVLSTDFAGKIDALSASLKKNGDLSAVISELLSEAATSVKADGSYGRISVDVPKDGAAGGIAGGLLDSLALMKEESACRMLDTMSGVIGVFNRTGAAALYEKDGNILSALSVPGTISESLKIIRECAELKPLANALASVGIDALSSGLGIEGDALKTLLDSTSVDLDSMTDEQIGNLELIVSSAEKVLSSVEGKTGTDVITSIDSSALQDLAAAIDGSGIIEGGSATLIEAVTESETIKNSGLIDEQTAQMLKEGGVENIGATVGSAQKSLDIVDQLSSEEPDADVVKEDIDWLIENMTPENADFITGQITADKLTSFGVPPTSAPGVERFIKILTEEITNAQNDPSVDSGTESAALVSIYTLGIGADTSGGDLFGPGKSDAQDLADSVFGSRIVGNTVVRTAIEDGKLTVDPIGCGVSLSNADRDALVSAINTSLSAAGYASADAAAKQKLSDRAVSLAAFFGLGGSVSSAGVLTVG